MSVTAAVAAMPRNLYGMASHNHPMFGAGARHLFTGFLGIRQKEDTAGYANIILRPCIPKKLQSISGSIETPHGRICVTAEQAKITVTVPKTVKLELVSEGEIHYV